MPYRLKKLINECKLATDGRFYRICSNEIRHVIIIKFWAS